MPERVSSGTISRSRNGGPFVGEMLGGVILLAVFVGLFVIKTKWGENSTDVRSARVRRDENDRVHDVERAVNPPGLGS